MENNQEKNTEANQKKLNEQANEDALKVVKEVKKETAEYRKQFESDWKIYDNAYYNRQHKTGEGIKTVKNHIFKLIETEIPMLTDSLPSMQFTASREDKQAHAEILSKAFKYVQQDQNFQLILPSLLRKGMTSAPGYLYVYHDDDAEDGNGKIIYKQLPWESVFLDGNVATIEDSEKCRIEINIRRDALIRKWPEFKEELKLIGNDSKESIADDENYEKRDISSKEDIESGKPNAYKAKDLLKYVETWIKDYSLKDISEEDYQECLKEQMDALKSGNPPEVEKWQDHEKHIAELKKFREQLISSFGIDPSLDFDSLRDQIEMIMQQNPMAENLSSGLLIVKLIDDAISQHEDYKKINPTSQEPKFEDGWRVIKTVGKVVLYDGPNPEENGEIPLVPFYSYKDDTIYSFGIIKNVLNAQQTLNDCDFREYEGLKVVSNPGWIADFEAEIDENDLTNKPGIVVQKKRGTEVRRLEPGQVSPQLERRKQFDQQSMESIEGINEQTMNGAAPVGNASGVAVQKIQTQPIGRIRLKGRNLEYYSIRRLSIIVSSFILNHWTDEKILRLRSDDNSIEEVVFNPLEMEDLEYSIDASPGSMAGVDKDQLITFYMMLLNNQQIDFEMFLAASPEFPGKHTLVKMYKEKNQQNAQIEQAKQQYEQAIVDLQQQVQMANEQNIKLKGVLESGSAISADLLTPEEKKIFEQHCKQAVLQSVLDQHDKEVMQQGSMEPITANQNNQGAF